MLEMIIAANAWLNGIVWGPPFMILLVGTGAFLTYKLGFFQFRYLIHSWKNSFGEMFRRDIKTEEGAISPFQAVARRWQQPLVWATSQESPPRWC